MRDLLADPELGLSLVAAEPDALDRPVQSAYITDLPDPSRFLSTGDVVLTSGLWLDRPGARRRSWVRSRSRASRRWCWG